MNKRSFMFISLLILFCLFILVGCSNTVSTKITNITSKDTISTKNNSNSKENTTTSIKSVNKEVPTLTINDTSKIYDGESLNVLYETNSDGKVSISYKNKNDSDSTYSSISPVNAGEYVVKIEIEESLNYESISLTKELTISKATPVLGTDYTIPEVLGVIKSTKLSSIDLTSYNLKWANEETIVNDNGTYYANYIPNDSINYESILNIEITISVINNLIEIPSLDKEFTYDGTMKSILVDDILNFDSENMNIVIDESILNGTNADSYKVTISLNEGYAWSDNTTVNKELYWIINPIVVDEPIVLNTNFTYDGLIKSPTITYDETYATLTGIKEETNAGTYTLTFTLLDDSGNYVWETNDEYVPLSYSWKIQKKEIEIPKIENTEFDYNGNEQTLIITYDSNYISVDGTIKETLAGSYSITFSLLNDNYMWNDSTSSNIIIEWKINKLLVESPTLSDIAFIYSSNEVQPTITYNDEYIKIKDNSTLSATNIGEYEIIFELKDKNNYAWKDDNSADDKVYSWTITEEIITIPSLDITYNYDGELKEIKEEDITNFDSSKMEIVLNESTLTATDSNEYKIVISLKDKTNSSWSNGETTDIILSWSIIDNSYDFSLTYDSGTKDCYNIDKNNETNEYTITFANITSNTVYIISGTLNGNVVIDVDESEEYEFDLVLNGVTITSYYNSPIYILSGSEVTIKSQNSTINNIYDYREIVGDDSDQKSAIIYSEVDLNMTGKGTLNLVSTNNNGIHTKDDLKIKNVTLNVTCMDNALKGNDEVEIESGTITLISKNGDGIKTSNSDLSSKGNQKGNVIISGGTVIIYAANDGIDAANDSEISNDETVVEIYTTSEYASNKVNDLSAVITGTYYIMVSKSYSYTYSIRYKTSTGYTMINASDTPTKTASNYYYYAIDTVSDATSFEIYCYSSSDTQGSTSSYYSKSSSKTLSSSYDTLKLTSISSSSISASWTLYNSSSSSNSDKLIYSAKGIKANNNISITGGTITIYAYDDGIHANSDEIIESTSTYGLGNVTLSGGTISVKSHDDGIHADGTLTINGANVTVLEAYEGLEGSTISMESGTATVTASDDGVNAAQAINVSGGRLDVTVSPSGDTDGIDSNGTITISGGIVITRGPNNQNMCPLDANSSISITGGTVIIIGYSSSSSRSGGSYGPGRGGSFGGGGGSMQGGEKISTSSSIVQTQSSSSGLSKGSHTVTIGDTVISYTNTYSYSGYTTVYSSATATIK